ncbi:MAG TPA: hypothetical protein VGR66_01885 [Candidatus Eisenbacteria bacterium]|jgi:hypothetical protein|nr:hypothetical protein [Candidatus Eisenbacteria bacterium]
MRSRCARGAVLVLALSLPGVLAYAGGHNASFNLNVKGEQDVITCSDIEMSFWKNSHSKDDIVTVRRDQSVAVNASRTGTLRLVASPEGGVWVQRSSSGTVSATVCLAAGAESQSEGNAILDQLRIVNEGGELRVKGPDGDWGAYIILSVPNGMSIDMEAENGALDVRGVTGTFSLRTENGPIGVAHVGGKVVARATNGPISFKGHEGDIDLKADNGPVSVKLNDPTWTGKGLDASTANGPISVFTPDGLKTGVRIEASENSPLSWKGHGVSMTSDWRDNPTIVLGKGPVLVRVSTVNGPVSIKSSSAPSSTGGKSRI